MMAPMVRCVVVVVVCADIRDLAVVPDVRGDGAVGVARAVAALAVDVEVASAAGMHGAVGGA